MRAGYDDLGLTSDSGGAGGATGAAKPDATEADIASRKVCGYFIMSAVKVGGLDAQLE